MNPAPPVSEFPKFPERPVKPRSWVIHRSFLGNLNGSRFFKANRAAPLSISRGLGQTTCFHLLVYFSQEGDQNIFSHALLLPIQTLYGKEEELETVPAQPPFSQPSHPTQ